MKGKMMAAYRAWCPDYGQDESDGRLRPAHHFEGPKDVAEQCARWFDIDSGDYSIAGGGETVRVLVRNLDTNEITKWDVRGEMDPQYSAVPADVPAIGCMPNAELTGPQGR
jgi:hypothetical protein